MRGQCSRAARVLAFSMLALGFTIGVAQAAALAPTRIADPQVIVITGPDPGDGPGPKVVVIPDPGPTGGNGPKAAKVQ
jgi:hypothetical protein